MAVAKKSFPVENFSYFVFVPIVTTRKPCRWRVVWLLQLSLRFSTVKFQFTVCVTKAPMFREISHGAPFCSSIPPSRIMPTKILPSNKSSRRRLNTGSALNSRQEATPASAEVIGAGAVQTSKRYYEWWLVYKLQTMVIKAWAELTMISKGVHDI